MHAHLLTAPRSSSRGEAARRRDHPTQVAWPAMHDGAGLRTTRLSLGMMLMLPRAAHAAMEKRAQEKSATKHARNLESLSSTSQRRFLSRWCRKIVTLTIFSHYPCLPGSRDTDVDFLASRAGVSRAANGIPNSTLALNEMW